MGSLLRGRSAAERFKDALNLLLGVVEICVGIPAMHSLPALSNRIAGRAYVMGLARLLSSLGTFDV